ncbi:myelin-associated glycoprotein-like isoform X2 [Denticeps clupeoides]|uniref:myelin-associated glycoprotein-like isoform X2 n=1 Tax=Denticeps clupeoides TaxID=299321 RepID=UPI0010A2DF21|nr:myelin-associated glycoprotein-like isoform X2 [Denticeps clupeoides]
MDEYGRLFLYGLFLKALIGPALSGEWRAKVVNTMNVLTSSCVVVPCTFYHPEGEISKTRMRGIWHYQDDWEKIVYNEESTQIEPNFRGRTKIVGDLGHDNCTLVIEGLKNHDNGPYCFRVEIPQKDKFSFVGNCVTFKVYDIPSKPQLKSHVSATEGAPYVVTCFMDHTCPSHPPELTWSSKGDPKQTAQHEELDNGKWRVTSTLIFIPTEDDDHSELTCHAKFYGGLKSSETLKVFVKRQGSLSYIIIPVVAVLATVVLFGGVCFAMRRKYMKRIQELQSDDNGIWSRMSRMSRRFRRSPHEASHGEIRQSVWSRFSRRPRGNATELNAGYKSNNIQSNLDTSTCFKPPFPSPKSNPKSANNKYGGACSYAEDNINTAHASIYGNI